MACTKKPHQLATGRALRDAAWSARSSQNSKHLWLSTSATQANLPSLDRQGIFIADEFVPSSPGLQPRARETAGGGAQ